LKEGYSIAIEGFDETYKELEPLYREHYAQMCARLDTEGIHLSPYKPRLADYSQASKVGGLLTFVVRFEGKAVGHSNVYLVNDLHNNELNGHEDTIYLTPEHRKSGIGRELIKRILSELKSRGIRRFYASPITDLRVAKLFGKMGFKHSAEQMIYHF
jgi:GNAT superfamily N-acetyltransferase